MVAGRRDSHRSSSAIRGHSGDETCAGNPCDLPKIPFHFHSMDPGKWHRHIRIIRQIVPDCCSIENPHYCPLLLMIGRANRSCLGFVFCYRIFEFSLNWRHKASGNPRVTFVLASGKDYPLVPKAGVDGRMLASGKDYPLAPKARDDGQRSAIFGLSDWLGHRFAFV